MGSGPVAAKIIAWCNGYFCLFECTLNKYHAVKPPFINFGIDVECTFRVDGNAEAEFPQSGKQVITPFLVGSPHLSQLCANIKGMKGCILGNGRW